jgi:hypothetical protein
MSDADMRRVCDKLRTSGVSLIALYYGDFPADQAACRTIFEKSKKCIEFLDAQAKRLAHQAP